MNYHTLYAVAAGSLASFLLANGMALTFTFLMRSAREVVAFREREEWRREILQACKR